MANESGFRDVSPLSSSSKIVTAENLANTLPPTTQDGIFNNLQVGVYNLAFYVGAEGMWLGSQNFATAPFKVAMDGTTTIGGTSIENALMIGDAAEDINTHATTISGGKITTGTITASQLAVDSVTANKIAVGAITSDKIAAGNITSVHIAAGTILANNIQAKTLTGALMADGTITALQILDATITGAKIAGSTISNSNIVDSTITGAKIAAYTITADKITVSSLSAITAALGTINSGTLNSVTISLPYSAPNGASSTGYLKWGGGNSKIWVDSNDYMGIRANGGVIYLYGGTSQVATFITGAQAILYYGLYCYNNLNVTGAVRVNGSTTLDSSTFLKGVNYIGSSTSNSRFYYVGSNVVGWYGHIDVPNAGVYNLGGGSTYWLYVNARGFSTHSLTSFDSPVELPDGSKVDDISALRSIRERKGVKDDRSGRALLDKRTFPIDTMIKAYDSKTGKEYDRDKNNDPLIPDDTGKLIPRPDADSVDLVQFTSLLYGGFKQLVAKVEELEAQLKERK